MGVPIHKPKPQPQSTKPRPKVEVDVAIGGRLGPEPAQERYGLDLFRRQLLPSDPPGDASPPPPPNPDHPRGRDDQVEPKIVFCHVTAYGSSGPLATWPGLAQPAS